MYDSFCKFPAIVSSTADQEYVWQKNRHKTHLDLNCNKGYVSPQLPNLVPFFLILSCGERPILSAEYGGCKSRSNLTCFITISQLHVSFSDQLYPPREAPSANVQSGEFPGALIDHREGSYTSIANPSNLAAPMAIDCCEGKLKVRFLSAL